MSKKNQNEASIGHNSASDELLKGYMEKLNNLTNDAEAVRGDIKEVLNQAKADGFLKTSLRKALKDLRMTEEQRQSSNEVQQSREEYVRICKELGLFVPEESEEAA